MGAIVSILSISLAIIIALWVNKRFLAGGAG